VTTEAVSSVDDGLLPPGVELSPTKRRLYETAMQLFGQEGYHAVSIRDIAQALGQQPSAIYFHVGGKQELLYELALIGHRTHFEAIRDALLDAGADPREQLRAIVVAHVYGHLDYPSMARLTNRELRALAPEQLTTVLAIRTATEQLFVDVLERGVRMGAFRTDDTFLVAKVIGAMGVRLPEWWTPDSPRTKEQIAEHYAASALKLVA
jgi:AcrR family transcriptional regulator